MSSFLSTVTIVLFTFLTGCISDESSKCVRLKSDNAKVSMETLDTPPEVQYTCPREFDPQTYTQCCLDGCCESSFLSMAVNDEWLLMVTAILVISSCLFLTVLVVVCCFWSKCPLYSACRVNYNTSNVIVYCKDDPTPLMPADGKGGQYLPGTVKIRKMQEV